MPTFNVTYEIMNEADFEHDECPDPRDSGFAEENVSLREAIAAVGHYAPEPSDSRVSHARWFTNDEYGHCYRTGDRESRSLHLPEHITPASRVRIARLLGCNFR